MLKEVTGDILLTDADVIVHGIAPNDHFDHDLSLSLKEQWPAMYKDFRHFCKVSHPKEGSLWTWATVNQKRIVNLFTQTVITVGPENQEKRGRNILTARYGN